MQEEGELTTGKDDEMRKQRAYNTTREPGIVCPGNSIQITIVQTLGEAPSFSARSEQVEPTTCSITR
jgi:hypothetical protein